MAITIINQPPSAKAGIQIMPAFNNISYTVSSTNTAQCKFKYVADIYVNGTNVKRLKQFANQTGQAEFKINKVLQDYLKNNPQINLLGFVNDPTRILEYQVKFGEEYDVTSNCSGTPTVFTNLTQTGIAYTWYASLQYKEYYNYINTTTAEFILSNAKPAKFLTHQPETILIGMGEQAELSFLNLPGFGTDASDLNIETFDQYGNLLDTRNITNPNTTVTNYLSMFNTVGVGPENINNYFGFPVINKNVFKYRVWLSDIASGVLNQNPFLQYMGGSNFWTTDSFPGCSSSFGITVANEMTFVVPDVSCGDTMTIQYTGGGFVPGITYSIVVNIVTVNNPSGNVYSVTPVLGGTVGTPFSGLGTAGQNIVCGPSGILELVGYMDADTAGFGSHSFSLNVVFITSQGGNRTSEYKYYEIDRRNTKYNPIRFRWLNRLGGYDSYSFNLYNETTTSIERTEYDKLLNTNYALGDRGRTLISVTAKDRVSANSNWLTEKESIWLENLYTSLNVFIQETNKIYNIKGFQPDVTTPTYFDAILSCPLSDEEILLLDAQNFYVDVCSIQLGITVPGIVLNSNTIALQEVIPFVNECGILYLANQSRPLIPIIIASNNFTSKTKGKTKNINQTIDFEYAFDKNIQRI